MINTNWDNEILSFIELSSRNNVRMIMVGGGAVNFHGYQRHSADVDFLEDFSGYFISKFLQIKSF